MGKKKNSRGKASSRFKSISRQTAPSSTEDARTFESMVASLRTPDELEHRSWQAAITVKNATILMLIATLAILVVTIAVPFAIEIFKARFANAPTHQGSVEPKQGQPANVESIAASPAASIQMAKESDSRPSSEGTQRSSDTGINWKKPDSSSLVASYLNQARVQYHQNRYSAALAECEKALRLDPHNQSAIALRSKIREAAQIMSNNDRRKH